ncbi:MAG TPA: hypothetical protein VFX35_06365 [Solirubrobacterales bacterium]|nr:hypothetical protein [Solirubrobacterales bacterium]
MEAALNHQTAPDELAFCEHVAGAEFQAGVDAGRWRLLEVTWPTATLAISAAARPNSPREFFFCFELSGYPAGATARPIDIATGQTLPAEMRPKGEIVGHAFRTDWLEALYVPWDRVAIEGHPEWRIRHARKLWNEDLGILSYLRPTHELLNSEDYRGV